MTATLDFPLSGKRIFVAGHRGMVGSALVRRLGAIDCTVITADRREVDLKDQDSVFSWLENQRPAAMIIAAGLVGGILANSTRPAEFLYDNLAIASNLIEGAHRIDMPKLLFLGSSCIYPKLAPQPITEDALLTSALEPTNEWYAIAKIAGVKLCEAYRQQYGHNFISAMPTNLYGPNDNFDLQSGHVLPAMIAKTHAAKLRGTSELEIWGTGTPRREFLHVDDLADACIFLFEHYAGAGHVNVGTGTDVTINELARMVADVVGWRGAFVNRTDRPDGTPQKLLDVTMINELGWTAKTPLRSGISDTYEWFCKHYAAARGIA